MTKKTREEWWRESEEIKSECGKGGSSGMRKEGLTIRCQFSVYRPSCDPHENNMEKRWSPAGVQLQSAVFITERNKHAYGLAHLPSLTSLGAENVLFVLRLPLEERSRLSFTGNRSSFVWTERLRIRDQYSQFKKFQSGAFRSESNFTNFDNLWTFFPLKEHQTLLLKDELWLRF